MTSSPYCSAFFCLFSRDHLPEFTSAVAAAGVEEEKGGEKRSAASYTRLLFQSLERFLEPSNPGMHQVYSLSLWFHCSVYCLLYLMVFFLRLLLTIFQLCLEHFCHKTGEKKMALHLICWKVVIIPCPSHIAAKKTWFVKQWNFSSSVNFFICLATNFRRGRGCCLSMIVMPLVISISLLWSGAPLSMTYMCRETLALMVLQWRRRRT